ncbi:MAG: RNase H-like domain-containing protein, partial [Candidatus Thorarchaeota archaeon]|nr:RNase H-like domain-containing protein [Candidatus Thorarchaeota archaeon]
FEFFVVDHLSYSFILGNAQHRQVMCGELLVMISFLDEMSEAFAETSDDDGGNEHISKLPEFSIQLLPGATPPPFRARRMHPKALDFLKQEVQQLLRKGIVRRSANEPGTWISHPLVVKKKDGTFRKVVDYRALNESTVPIHYPLPIIDELFQKCAESKYFSKFDLKQAYWQIPVEESSKKFLAFAIEGEVFEYEKCSMGPRNVPAFFNGVVMSEVLEDEIREGICLQYFDDVLILGATVEENIANCIKVISKLRKYGFKIGLRKCEFVKEEIGYLGFLVNSEGRRIDPERFQALRELQPRTKRQLQGVLGLLNYYRDFVQGYAKLSDSLYSKLQEKRFSWGEEDQASLMHLVDSIVNSRLIPFVDFEKPFVLRTDASDIAVGGVLYQVGVPVAICSSSLKGAQRRWITQEKELWGIIFSVRKWKHWLQFSPFVIITDNRNVLYLHSSTSPKVQRWHAELQQFDYSLRWSSGDSNSDADTISRATLVEEGNSVDSNIVAMVKYRKTRFSPKGRTRREIVSDMHENEVEADANDSDEGDDGNEDDVAESDHSEDLDVGEGIESGPLSLLIKQSQKAHRVRGVKDSNGVLRNSKGGVVLIPAEDRQLVRTLLTLAHDEYGHVGYEKVKRLLENYAWVGKSKDIRTHLKTCFRCIKSKIPFVSSGELHVWFASKPFSIWHIDHQGPFKTSVKGNQYILCCVDRFSKYVVLVPVSSTDAKTTASAIISNVFAYFGVPDLIITDRGPAFKSVVWKEVCNAFHVPFHLTTAYHHQSNGQVERLNRFVLAMLRTLMCSTFKNWDYQLPFIQSVINSTVSTSTQFSPSEIVFGQKLPSLLNQLDLCQTSETLSEYVQELKKQLEKIREKAHANMKKYGFEMKKSYEKGKKKAEIGVGDYVLYRELRNHKLQDSTGGPAEVLEIMDHGRIRVFDIPLKNILILNESEVIEIDRTRTSVQKIMDESYMEALRKFE